MMRSVLSVSVVSLFLCFMSLFSLSPPSFAQDCPSAGTIVGTGSVFWQTIDCGDGHDCRIQVCGGGEFQCCATNGGFFNCTWCDIQSCGLYTVYCIE